jgi:hypothetical protein
MMWTLVPRTQLIIRLVGKQPCHTAASYAGPRNLDCLVHRDVAPNQAS